MATRFRIHAALLTCGLAAACGSNNFKPGELGSGDIRSVMNIGSSNALALDAAADPGRPGVFVAALEAGEADFGFGVVGRPLGEPPVMVVGRYNEQLEGLWVRTVDATFTQDAHPVVAVDPDGNLVFAAASLVTEFSLADGFSRWSTTLPVAGDPTPRVTAVDADGSVVVASAITESAFNHVRLDRLSGSNGSLLVSHNLGVATGNVTIDSLGEDADGNLFAGGSFDAALTLAQVHTAIAGQHAGYITKLGRDSGQALWSRQVRRRNAGDKLIVAPLASGDIAVAGIFAFADDPSDTDNPLGPSFYLRIARLSAASGATVWTTRVNLPNTAALDVVDLADGAEDLLLAVSFSGNLQLGPDILAVGTAPSSMANIRFDADDGTPRWLRYSNTTEAHAFRIGVDGSGDAVAAGTFVSQDAESNPLQTIFLVRIVP